MRRKKRASPLIDDFSALGQSISVRGVSLWYGDFQALYDIYMDIPARQICAFIGPSGCGKSTLLNCFNRMNDLVDGCRVQGNICIGETDVYVYRVLRIRKLLLETSVLPSSPIPPTTSVIHMGSPPKSSLYSGVLR